VARIFDQEIPRDRLLEAVGDLSQVCGISSFCFDDGPGRGVRALEFRTGGGLRFIVLPDRGLDIYQAEYRGLPLNWLSGTGPVSPALYSPKGWDWLRSFFGGLLTTCGLSNVGDPCDDQGAYLPEEHFGGHGRISNTPAQALSVRGAWEGERYRLSAEGEMLETAGQGEKLRLARSIRCEMGSAAIQIADRITNEAYSPVPVLFLYHINFGFPLLDGQARLFASCRSVTALDAAYRDEAARLGRFHPPAESQEMVFLLDLQPDRQGRCSVVLANPAAGGAGLGVALTFAKADFPYFHVWKRLCPREYVLGFEPGICSVLGRKRQREMGDLRLLAPQESIALAMQIEVLGSAAAVDEFCASRSLRRI
jgi:hypothetical protein